MGKYYQRPTENFYMLPNSVFDLRLDPIQFAIYSYIISSSGSKGHCWPSQKKICDKTSIGITAAQKHLKILEKRKLIEIRKHDQGSRHKSDDYYPLRLGQSRGLPGHWRTRYRNTSAGNWREFSRLVTKWKRKQDKARCPGKPRQCQFTPPGNNLRDFGRCYLFSEKPSFRGRNGKFT